MTKRMRGNHTHVQLLQQLSPRLSLVRSSNTADQSQIFFHVTCTLFSTSYSFGVIMHGGWIGVVIRYHIGAV